MNDMLYAKSNFGRPPNAQRAQEGLGGTSGKGQSCLINPTRPLDTLPKFKEFGEGWGRAENGKYRQVIYCQESSKMRLSCIAKMQFCVDL